MAWQHTLQARWGALGARERRALTGAAAVVGVALLWSVALAPALRTLHGAEARNTQLAAVAERMQTLQARAQQLQAQPQVAPQEALKTLQASAAGMGKGASLQLAGDLATLTLTQVSAQALAPWLAGPPGTANRPTEAHLQRDANSAEPLWSGSLVFRLPSATAKP